MQRVFQNDPLLLSGSLVGRDLILSQFFTLPLRAVLIKVNFVNQKWLLI